MDRSPPGHDATEADITVGLRLIFIRTFHS